MNSEGMTDLAELLQTVAAVLKRLLELREYDEASSSWLQIREIKDAVEELGDHYEMIVSDHDLALVAISSLREVVDWRNEIVQARDETSAIDLDRVSRSDHYLSKATDRSTRWATEAYRAARERIGLFISFDTRDKEMANEVHEVATELGINAFCSSRDLRPGVEFAEAILSSLIASDHVLVVATEASLSNVWVAAEWGVAWAFRKPIVPLLVGVPREDLPDQLSRRQCLKYGNRESLATDLRWLIGS